MLEVRQNFRSLTEWLSYMNSGALIAQSEIDNVGKGMMLSGAVEPLTQNIVPAGELTEGSGWREGLIWQGVNSRTRAVMLVLEELLVGIADPRIYAAEGLTAFALRLRGMFPRFIGSEYSEERDKLEYMFPIPFEDLTALSFRENLFDMVSTNEVLEHVPSIDKALGEICRVLKPGGWHVGTHPFLFLSESSVVRAAIRDGKLVHIMEPEWHGNPMSAQGSLVFEVPGWDIIERAKTAGFSDAYMRFVVSEKHACLADYVGGTFVLCCQK